MDAAATICRYGAASSSFTAYLAKYEGGNWDSTVELEDGQIWKGSLPNLLYIITKLSKNKIHAEPQAVPLNLTSGEIFEKKPPFIWFTAIAISS